MAKTHFCANCFDNDYERVQKVRKVEEEDLYYCPRCKKTEWGAYDKRELLGILKEILEDAWDEYQEAKEKSEKLTKEVKKTK